MLKKGSNTQGKVFENPKVSEAQLVRGQTKESFVLQQMNWVGRFMLCKDGQFYKLEDDLMMGKNPFYAMQTV